MKKYCLCVLCLVISCLLFSGCDIKQKTNTINYHRKLEKYITPATDQKPANGIIDLSDGQKTRYDAKFGPKDLNFDIKLNTTY